MKFKVTVDSRKFTFQSEEIPSAKWENVFMTLGAVPDYDRSSIRASQIHIGFDDFDSEVMEAQSSSNSYEAAESTVGNGASSQQQQTDTEVISE